MNRTKKMVLASLLAAGLLGVGGAAMAGPGGPDGRGGMFGKAFFKLFSDLDLTEQQELQAIRARRAIKEQMKEARKETQQSMTAAIDELAKERPDARKLHSSADEAIARFSKIVHSAIDQMLALHATLSPEQRATLAANAKEMQERREERMERFQENKKPAKR